MSADAAADEIIPAKVRELLDAGEAQVVDVRTGEEREGAYIAGSTHLPLEELGDSPSELDRDKPVVFYCRSGERSAMAAGAFSASGWDASSMKGGIVAWSEGGFPIEPADGEIRSPSGLPPK